MITPSFKFFDFANTRDTYLPWLPWLGAIDRFSWTGGRGDSTLTAELSKVLWFFIFH